MEKTVTKYVVYYDLEYDMDRQREAVNAYLAAHGGEVAEEHYGGEKAAQASANALNVPLMCPATPDTLLRQPETGHVAGKVAAAADRYAELAPKFREAALLGITSNTGIANYLNETSTPLPSGKMGKWQAIQVKRAKKWIGE